MKLIGQTILVTGGAAGIGYAFAERFLKAGNTVIVCGRREEKLQEAKMKYPDIHTRVCDVANEAERMALYEWVSQTFPDCNVLVNNAGIQQRTNLLDTDENWAYHSKEIAINFEAPVHLSMLFLNHLKAKKNAAIINVTSGLAFTPMAKAAIYSATKAALHSFTMSLRHQVSNTNIEVIEVAPPAVNTDLFAPGAHTFGADLDEFADAIFEGLKKEKQEIGFGTSAKALRMSRDEIDEHFKNMNNR